MSQSTFVKSTLILTIASLLSKILGSIFRIPLQNIAGDEVLGIFSLVYPVYMVALILSVAGIPIAISKLIAEARAENNQAKIKEIYVTAKIVALLFGMSSFTFIFIFSEQIANLLGGPATEPALIVVSMTLLVAPYMAVYRGYFQGFEDMRPTAISQVIEQFVRVGLILFIAYFLVAKNYSNEIIAGGVMSGSITGAFASLLFLSWTYRRSPLKFKLGKAYSLTTFRKWSKRILAVSIPIAIGSITMALLNFVDSFTIPYGLRASGVDAGDVTYLYGIYGRGLSLVQIATVFATSIVLPLIPHITKKLAEKDMAGTKAVIEKTNWMTHVISWPAAAGLVALTLPVNLALFTNLEGSTMLAIINLSSVFTSLTIVGTGILQGMNFAKLAAWVIIAGVGLKTILNILFVQLYGLNGAAIATLVVYIVLTIMNTVFIYRKIPFTFINRPIIKMIVSAGVMGLVIYLPIEYFDVTTWSRMEAFLYVLLAVGVGAVIYFVLLYLLKVINKQMLKDLPLIGKFIK